MMKKLMAGLLTGVVMLGSAQAAAAADVTVEIEGGIVVEAAKTVTLPAGPVSKDGSTCAADTAAAALDVATSGDWGGQTSQYGFALHRIRNENRPFGPDGSWALYINGKQAAAGSCVQKVGAGDRVLFYWSNSFAQQGYDEPVLLNAPTVAQPGVPVEVTVNEVKTETDPPDYTPVSTISPSAGAEVTGGTAAVTTNAEGKATVTLPPGPYTLVAKRDNRAPSRISGCATTGRDGFCGSPKIDDPNAPTPAPLPVPCSSSGNDGLCGSSDRIAPVARMTTFSKSRYRAGRAPKTLRGRSWDAVGISKVELRLTQRRGSRCTTYSDKAERWVRARRCGVAGGRWFTVGKDGNWSYLLPRALARGRHVIDLRVTDTNGNSTRLVRGWTRNVITVR